MTSPAHAARTRFPTAALLAGLSLAVAAQADQGFYLGAMGGVTLTPDTAVRVSDADGNSVSSTGFVEPGPTGSVVAGYTFANGLRPELDLGYRHAEFENAGGDYSSSHAIGNVFYNISRRGYFFYLGGGAGYADVRVKLDQLGKDDDGVPVYSLGAGFGVPIGRQLMVGVDYRYVAGFERNQYDFVVQDTPLTGSFRYRSHFVGLGLRYSFGSALADSYPARRPTEPVSVVPVGN